MGKSYDIDRLLEDSDKGIMEWRQQRMDLWDKSIQKWRGVTFDEFIGIHGYSVDTFNVGADIYFMRENECKCGKIRGINIYIGKETRVRYSVDSVNNERLDSNFVFASKAELKEHLRLGIVNPTGFGKGYGASDFKTSSEDLLRTGYSIKHYDLPYGVGHRVWLMYDNICVEKCIEAVNIEVTEDGCDILFTLEFNDGHRSNYIDYSAEKLFNSKEELLTTL